MRFKDFKNNSVASPVPKMAIITIPKICSISNVNGISNKNNNKNANPAQKNDTTCVIRVEST